ncbi:MAG TPA: chorismate synthase [Limnochordia bacterium]
MLRFLTAGESHGQSLVVVIEGMPAGLPLPAEVIDAQLARRQLGYGRGRRQQIERDRVRILSGVRYGETLGSPIALQIENRDWKNWEERMAVEPPAGDRPSERVRCPRPGHADLAGALKYGHRDLRNVLERASARETAARVAVGGVARQLLARFGIELFAHVVALGPVEATLPDLSWEEIAARAEASAVRCADEEASERMMAAIDAARAEGDTLGGVFEVRVRGVPVGLGSHVHWDRKLDGRLAGALMSVQAIKGVEIGLGFTAARRRGSEVHDPIAYRPYPQRSPGVEDLRGPERPGFYHLRNNAGGIEGGITNGEEIVVRAAMKPISTLYRPLPSVDFESKEPAQASVERSDICALPAAAVVGEGVVAFEIARAFLEKFGGDSIAEVERNWLAYLESLRRA